MRNGFLAVPVVLGILAAGGCAQRPLAIVKADGNEAYARGDYDTAWQHYGEWVQRTPSDPAAHFHLGRAMLAQGSPRAAREQLELAYRLEPTNVEYLDGLTDALIATEEVDDLLALLRQLAEDEGSAAAFLRMARATARAGLPDEAAQALRQALAIEPRSITARRAAAEFARSIGDTGGEIRHLRVLLGLDPTDARTPARLRELGQVPGPSFVLTPEQADAQ